MLTKLLHKKRNHFPFCYIRQLLLSDKKCNTFVYLPCNLIHICSEQERLHYYSLNILFFHIQATNHYNGYIHLSICNGFK